MTHLLKKSCYLFFLLLQVSGKIPTQPSDLPHFIARHPRPILKPPKSPILVKEVPEEEDEDIIFENPCKEFVTEKEAVIDVEDPEPPKRVSKFKAMRSGLKK